MEHFDYENAAREAGISKNQLEQIIAATRIEFPHDDMMLELHILRACMAIRDGLATVDQVLSQPAALKS